MTLSFNTKTRIFIILYTAAIFSFYFTATLDLKTTALIYLAGFGLTVIINPLVKPFVDKWKEEAVKGTKSERVKMAHWAVKQAKAGFFEYKFGSKRDPERILIYARSQRKADAFYAKYIAELVKTRKYKNARLYFIHPACHNLPNYGTNKKVN